MLKYMSEFTNNRLLTKKNNALDSLFDQNFPLNDIIFIVNSEKIQANRFMLANSSKFFRQKFASARSSPINFARHTINDVEHVEHVEPNSMRVMLRYLYGQNIDDAIKCYRVIPQNSSYESDNRGYSYDDDEAEYVEFKSFCKETQDIFVRYKDLLKLANDYELDHLKELMEGRLSRSVTRSNVEEMKSFAETYSAVQLKKYCNQFILENEDTMFVD